jgi:gamma-glutamylcyclotransferase (GGCT)/AIG2-like uncharacterized protein YtfP
MKYFAYGMNTNLSQMAMRCPKAVSLGAGVLLDHEFRFARHADVLENTNEVAYGVLWDITAECLASLDALEGYPTYYERKMVTVRHRGKNVQAMTYYMVGNLPDEHPSDGYVAMLEEGYCEHGVPLHQIYRAIEFVDQYHASLAQKSQWIYG